MRGVTFAIGLNGKTPTRIPFFLTFAETSPSNPIFDQSIDLPDVTNVVASECDARCSCNIAFTCCT